MVLDHAPGTARLPRLVSVTQLTQQHGRSILLWCGAGSAALIAAMTMQHAGLLAPADSGLLALDFDTARVTVIDRVVLTLLAALIGTLLFRRRSAAWVGAMVFFLLAYLVPFIQDAQHPLAGSTTATTATLVKQVLLPDMLWRTVLELASIAATFAAIGAAIGYTLADLLLVPLLRIGQWIGGRLRQHGRRVPVTTGLTLASGVALAILVLVTIQNIGQILTFGPTAGLYQFEGTHARAAVPVHGRVVLDHYASTSLGGMQRTFYVYLPPSYDSNATQRYPTLYLLHGSPGGAHNWIGGGQATAIADALIAIGKMRETILVFPDGNGTVIRYSEWANSFDGRQRMEDAIAHDLVTYVDRHYRTLASAAYRAIGGLSEGGYGAVNIALHHPELFGAALSEGGYFIAQGPVFGYGSAALAYHDYNSPLRYIQTPSGTAAMRKLTFIIGDGTLDGFYLQQSTQFVHALQRAHARVTFLSAPGNHSWTLWTLLFEEAVPRLEPASGAVSR